jgi:hypothetical protein
MDHNELGVVRVKSGDEIRISSVIASGKKRPRNFIYEIKRKRGDDGTCPPQEGLSERSGDPALGETHDQGFMILR